VNFAVAILQNEKFFDGVQHWRMEANERLHPSQSREKQTEDGGN
jgi:hypothetical protein